MDQDKLREIIESHGSWLRGRDGSRADLRRANLCGVNLCGVNLCGANLCDADLRDANLSRANLCGADLSGADLSGANLRGADLRDANLCGADLSGANLRRANLRRANLRGANLRRANLSGADLPDKILQVGPIGSRKNYTLYNVTRDVVQCGCWGNHKGGTLAEFEARVNDVYAANSTYGNEYRRVIEWFKAEREAIYGGKL